jgi:hypothetical protein
MQVVEDHQLSYETREHTSLFRADPLCVQLKEPATVTHHASLKIIQQEAPSQCVNTSAADHTSFVPCPSAICGEVRCPKAGQNVIQYGDKSVPNYDQDLDNISSFEGASNLKLKIHHSLNLRAECEKKDVCVVPSSGSDKSVQDKVHHATTNLKFQTNLVPSSNVMP